MQPIASRTRIFSRTERAHLCPTCGGATPVPVEGGTAHCVRCAAAIPVGPRPEELPRVPTPVTEPDRLARLAAQQHTPMMPPPAIAPLFANGGLSAIRRSEAEASWQALRRAVVAAPHDLSSADALYVLTLGLVGLPDEDPARARARLETAREILPMPRHQGGLACSLARIAAREDEVDAAQEWLALVDPQTDDLETDSGRRFALALIATTTNDFAKVLAVLGSTSREIPLHLATQATCAVLRANALERSGRIEEAVASLRADMAEGRLDAVLVEQIRSRFPRFALIAQSWPQVNAARASARSKSAIAFWGPMAFGGIVFLLVGLASFVPAAIGLVLSMFPTAMFGPLAPAVTSFTSHASFGSLIFGFVFAASSSIWFGIAWSSYKSGRDAAWLEEHGAPAQARLIAVKQTGIRINDQPIFDLSLRVEMEGRAPYEASLRQLVPFHQLGLMVPGAVLQVKVDPANPTRLAPV
ncbi:hypothetical protein [Sandaracinus amylolyticus]|uniref:hypothetical protein n=1 Tax=Sandaracinus amylolyticus TaxID=927083 RepID=UPI001F22C8A4|nr:hypothetical protein [Sandaracinus amylolyticus]UJR84953.1 Hypothetical protein I5071_70320 [Sandaracinus amylolyticus]